MSVLLTLRIALEWTQYQGIISRSGSTPDINGIMSEIMYELSGERLTKKQVSILVKEVLKLQ